MLCGITLSQLRKNRSKTYGFCPHSHALHPGIHVNRHDVTQRSVDIATGSDVRETENCATVAYDALRSRSVIMMSSFDDPLQLTKGWTVNKLKFYI